MDCPTLEPNPYLDIQAPDNVRVRGTRIDFSIIVEEYLEGRFPEQMVLDYPSLDLEAVYGVITYYLGHREDVDRYVAACRAREEKAYEEYSRAPEPPVVTRLKALRAQTKVKAA